MKDNLWFLFLLLLIISCSDDSDDSKYRESSLTVRIRKFPEALQPVNYVSVEAKSIIQLLYEFPEVIDNITNAVRPGFAMLQSIDKKSDTLCFSYKINEKAYWKNGFPITSSDIEASLKIYNLPGLNNNKVKLQISQIHGFGGNGDSFELFGVGNIENLRPIMGTFLVLPKHIYDPEGILDDISLQEIKENIDVKKDRIAQYLEFYQLEELQSNIDKEISAGYRIQNWEPGQSITLDRVPGWWGYSAGGERDHLKTFADRIHYTVIPDESVALIALKNNAIDVLPGISPHEFAEMQSDFNMNQRFHLLTPVGYRFVFLALNSRLEKFDLKVRQALAHLMPYEDIINVAALGFGQRTIGPINPVDSTYYNNLDFIKFDNKNFEKLLSQSGHQFKNGKWLNKLDEPLSFNLIYRSGNQLYESIALILKEQFENNGLGLEINSMEGSLVSKKLKSHDFELSLWAFRGGPYSHNFAPLFSTEAANIGGMNYSGFGNHQSDSVIYTINNAEKKETKIKALHELQRLLHEEKAVIFLFFEKDRIAVSKRFKNVYGFSRSPGYDVTQFQLANPN